MTTNLQQSITVLHRSLMNIWLFCNWNILQSLSILLLYISIRKGVWVFFLEEMFLAFFRKTAFFFPFNNVFDCLLSAGVSILRLSQ